MINQFKMISNKLKITLSVVKKHSALLFFSILLFCIFTLYHINKDGYLYQMYKQESIEQFYLKKIYLLNASRLDKAKYSKKSTVQTIEITLDQNSTNINITEDVITCYNVTEGDALPSIEDIIPPKNSIFFHETSCRECLNSRQACTIESAAKAHPGRKIYVLFSGPISENILNVTQNSITELKQYPNIVFARIHVKEYAKGTLLEDLFANEVTYKSKWKIIHTSDLLRVITMFKYGGLFLDTDTLVLKPMDKLGKNWVGKETYDELSNAAMHVDKDELGQSLIKMLLTEISRTYISYDFTHNGRSALQRVFRRFCNVSKIEDFNETTCRGFNFYEPELIYPVPWYEYKDLFRPGFIDDLDLTDAYTFHFWNLLSASLEVERKSPFDRLAQIHCPVIYKLYENGESFGY